MGSARPLAFKVYFAALVVVLTAIVAAGVVIDPTVDQNLFVFAALTVLFIVAERANLAYYDGEVRWGLSASEAILIPMLFALSPTQVIIGAVIAGGSVFHEWRDPAKQGFNVAQFGCAAVLATAAWTLIENPATSFGVRDAAAAVVAATTFTLATQLFVGLAIQLARQGKISDAFGDVRSTIVFGLSGAITLGLFAAAAYTAEPWTLLLFPLALAGLYLGYRAVARQAAERTRMERLHSATRSLANTSELPTALEGFLLAVADALSTVGARAIVQTEGGVVSSTVYEGKSVERIRSAEPGVESFLRFVQETGRPLTFGPDTGPVPDALRTSGTRNLLAVPVVEDGTAVGLLIVSDRFGAAEFGSDDIRLLEALAADLALTLRSQRLFNAVVQERERFQLLVESVSDYAIYMLDPEGHVVSWNSGAERILGYTADEILGRHYSTFYPPDAHRVWHEELRGAALRGRFESEGERVRRDGSLFVANAVITPVRAADGTLTGFAKVTRDVTERLRAETEKEALQAQLHQAQKLESVGHLAGGVAHDFNNLISVITNAASFALQRLPKEHEAVEDLRDVKQAAKRATELTRQLLIFSRRDLHKPQAVNVNEVVRQALKLLTRALGERVVIRAELDDSIGAIKADPGQLEQVLMNLAINARDAMPGGGTLTIETAGVTIDAASVAQYMDLMPGPHLRVTVTDTGTGMNPAVMQKAFDPFFTTKPKGSGTGLGLATVYGIVKGAKGHIQVMSTEGLGTTFEILFPVAPAGETHAEDGAASTSIQLDGDGETILLVEDDESVRSIARRLLERRGYVVVEASGSKEALQLLPGIRDSIALLLTDIVMPQMTGVELAHRARSMIPALKVIYMSGYSSGVFSSGGAELEGELVQKPFEEEDLLKVVTRVMHAAPTP